VSHADRFREDAAAWVLGALPDDEARAFAAHLDGCPACRAEVEELRAAADTLPTLVPSVAPPPELRDRIMAVVEAEAEVLRAAGSAADRPARGRRPRWLPGRGALGALGGLRPALAAAAVALLLAGLAGGFGLAQLGGDGDEVRTVRAQVTAPGAQATLRVRDEGGGRLEVRGLPAPPEGRVYQVWLLPEGSETPRPTTSLFTVTSDGRAAAPVPDVSGAQAVLVSDEPPGGSSTPTGSVVITAPLI